MKMMQIVPTYLPATRYGGPIYSVHGLSKALAVLIHTTAQLEKYEFEQFGFRQHKICIILNGVDTPEVYSAADVSDDIRDAIRVTPYLLFIGRLNWIKGLYRLLNAMSGVPNENRLIVGNDEEDYLKTIRNLVRENALEDWITIILRFVSGANKEALFASATLFVLICKWTILWVPAFAGITHSGIMQVPQMSPDL